MGVSVFVGTGKGKNKLLEILNGKGNGTYISNRSRLPINTKKQWIALHSESNGKVFVDQGARDAILYNGKSLLSAGVLKVKGTFDKGDVVEVIGMNGVIGKGLVSCTSDELKDYIEEKNEKKMTAPIPSFEVIHRDNWVDSNYKGSDLNEYGYSKS